jgi:glycosidase
MLDGDPARIRMVYSLMFSLPGTPVLFYGEELGMGEDLRAKGRSAVRSPMQWTDTANGGFSTAPADKLVAQVVDGYFGPKNINAAQAKRDPDSLWNFIAALIRSYRESPELAWGDFELIKQSNPGVLLHSCTRAGSTLVLAHNMAAQPASVSARVSSPEDPEEAFGGAILRDLLDGDNVPLADDGGFELELERYGYRWFRIQHPADRRI